MPYEVFIQCPYTACKCLIKWGKVLQIYHRFFYVQNGIMQVWILSLYTSLCATLTIDKYTTMDRT